MAEVSREDKYIRCSKCKCKYINDAEHIEVDFGYNRLDVRYKTCVKCRDKQRNIPCVSGQVDYYRKYCITCEICNKQISKYTMKRHVEVCIEIQSLREEMNKKREHLINDIYIYIYIMVVFITTQCLTLKGRRLS